MYVGTLNPKTTLSSHPHEPGGVMKESRRLDPPCTTSSIMREKVKAFGVSIEDSAVFGGTFRDYTRTKSWLF